MRLGRFVDDPGLGRSEGKQKQQYRLDKLEIHETVDVSDIDGKAIVKVYDFMEISMLLILLGSTMLRLIGRRLGDSQCSRSIVLILIPSAETLLTSDKNDPSF